MGRCCDREQRDASRHSCASRRSPERLPEQRYTVSSVPCAASERPTAATLPEGTRRTCVFECTSFWERAEVAASRPAIGLSSGTESKNAHPATSIGAELRIARSRLTTGTRASAIAVRAVAGHAPESQDPGDRAGAVIPRTECRCRPQTRRLVIAHPHCLEHAQPISLNSGEAGSTCSR